MATNYDLNLVVDADTTEARKKLDELADAANVSPEVREAASRVREAAGIVAEPDSAPEPRTAQPRAPEQTPPTAQPRKQVWSPEEFATEQRMKNLRQSIQEIKDRKDSSPVPQTPRSGREQREPARAGAAAKPDTAKPDDFGRKAGEVAGRAIGKAVAGYVAHELAATAFAAMKTPGGDNRAVNMAEAGVGSALQYGTLGAMIGGIPGAVIGAVGGAAAGFFRESTRQQKMMEARDSQITMDDRARTVRSDISKGDDAFERLLELSGGWRQRIDMMRERRNTILNGEGDMSVKNLTEALKQLDPESDEGKMILARLQSQKDRAADLDRRIGVEELAVAPSRMDEKDGGDSWSRKGISVGATVDVSQVNERIMGEVQQCRMLLQQISRNGTDNAAMGNGPATGWRGTPLAIFQ